MKTIYIRVISLTILIILVAFIYEYRDFMTYKISDPHFYRIYLDKSINNYAVVFDQGAWQGSSDHFGVIDKNESDLIILGTLDYMDLSHDFIRFVVSIDKSVIASESYSSFDHKKISYWIAYDFANSISYGGKWYPWDEDPNLIETRDRAIQKLLQSRGGIGQEINYFDFKQENKLSYFAWKKWQKQVDEAIEKCKPWSPDDTAKQSN